MSYNKLPVFEDSGYVVWIPTTSRKTPPSGSTSNTSTGSPRATPASPDRQRLRRHGVQRLLEPHPAQTDKDGRLGAERTPSWRRG